MCKFSSIGSKKKKKELKKTEKKNNIPFSCGCLHIFGLNKNCFFSGLFKIIIFMVVFKENKTE